MLPLAARNGLMSSFERAQPVGARPPARVGPDGVESPSAAPDGVAAKVAGSAVSLAGRRAAALVLTGLSTAFVARFLGPGEYGTFGSAIATWTLFLAASDFGFGLLLGRDLAVHEHARGRMLATAYQLQGVWAGVLAIVMGGLAFASGLDGAQGQTLLVLALSLPASALNGARTLSLAIYKTGQVVLIDIAVNVVQVALMIAVAASGAGAPGVAAVVSAGTLVNFVLIAVWARRHTTLQRVSPGDRRRMVRDVLPLGLAGFLSKVYLLIDLVVLGWLVSGRPLGDYAAAAKLLTVLVTVPGLVMAAALPAFSTAAGSRAALEELSTKVWHWLLVFAMPVFLVTGLCAPLVVEVAVGSQFDSAATLLRVLSLAGAIGVLSNLLGTILVAKGIVRIMLWQNAFALLFNVIGNVVLVPIYGVIAAAWLTVATEVIVCSASLIVLGRRLSMRSWLAPALRLAPAYLAGAGAALLLSGRPAIAAAGCGAAFLLGLWLARGWPEDLVPGSWTLRRGSG